MKMEVIFSNGYQKHIDHIKETGIEKVQFDAKELKKIPAILKYINDYCSSTGAVVKHITEVGEGAGTETKIYLELS